MLIAVATFWLGFRARTEDEWVRHTLAVRNQISTVLLLVQGAETSQRGYLLAGREDYLKPFNDANAALPAALDALDTLTDDNPRQQEAIAHLRQLVVDKQQEMQTILDLHRSGQHDVAVERIKTDKGLTLMQSIRGVVEGMEREENRLLALRQASAATLGTMLRAGAASALLLICGIGVLMAYFTRRSFVELASAHDQLAAKNRALVEEVQQREKVEGQLRQSQKMEAIGQLTGGIAHDFNNMLGVIMGSLDLIQRRIKKGDFSIERFLDAASKGTERAAALTHRLLAFARQQPLAPETIDANKMIASMSELLGSTLGEQVRIETVVAAGLWKTHADSGQLESALLNIAINARDAMPDGGKLTIETGNAYLDEAYCRQHAEVEPGQYVMIAMTDTGSGMPPEVIARAFDPFFTTKPPGKGTGLGLSQVYGFLKQSRGHINIYSELGAGTTVKLYLPRLAGAPAEAAQPAAQATEMAGGGETIVVVEDDPLMRRLATEALRELGYTVFDTDNAQSALAILDSEPGVNLLFTDVVMPEVNGRKLADEALRRRPTLKVLFTTGYTPNAVVHGGVLDPGVSLLTKPFTLEQLALKIRAVLSE